MRLSAVLKALLVNIQLQVQFERDHKSREKHTISNFLMRKRTGNIFKIYNTYSLHFCLSFLLKNNFTKSKNKDSIERFERAH